MPRVRALPLFLGLSLTAHAVLFMAWQAGRARETIEHGMAALGSGALTVALTAHQARADRAPVTRQRGASGHDSAGANAVRVVTAPRAAERLAVTTATDTGETRPAPSPATMHNYLLGKVRTEFERYFQYPALARERGWQGRVVLGFSLQADGHLDRIHVAQSSGYHLLDESARTALHQVGALADARQWLPDHAVDMQLPVIYRLLDR